MIDWLIDWLFVYLEQQQLYSNTIAVGFHECITCNNDTYAL